MRHWCRIVSTFFSPLPPNSKRKTYPSDHCIIKNIDIKLLDYNDLRLTQILVFGVTSLDINTNSSIFITTIDLYVISSKRFEEPLFSTTNFFFSAITIFYQHLFCILFPFIMLIFFRALYLCFLCFLFLSFICFLVYPLD